MVRMELKTLFSPGKIGNVEIKNRIVRSATFTHRAEKYGRVGEKLIKLFIDLARGGTGLIIKPPKGLQTFPLEAIYRQLQYFVIHSFFKRFISCIC